MTINYFNPLKKATAGALGVALLLSGTMAMAQQCPPIQLGEKHPAQVGKDMRTEHTQPWCDSVCVTVLANGTACANAAGGVVGTSGFCHDSSQSVESIKDIEYNLCIDIDDRFIREADYGDRNVPAGQSRIPGTDYEMSSADAAFYFATLFSVDSNGNNVIDGAEVTLASERGWQLANELDSNGDGTITRNEAGQVKGSDQCQLLSTGFSSGLATDDILSYIGLYLGEPMIDKYAGDLEGEDKIKEKLLEYTRTWQPSYWKDNGRTIAGSASGVKAFYDPAYTGTTRRVCEAGYNGPYKALYNSMRDGANTGNPGTDDPGSDDSNTGNPGSNLSDYLDSSCGSSHPYRCPSNRACFTEEQMNNYCSVPTAPSTDPVMPPVDDTPPSDEPDDLIPSDNCGDSHPYWCASRGQCFTEQQMNNYCL
ncbi:hypothetical protein [Marinibactrum halimedae]|uniref:EF-hand domain-containing protein n=1 Tax=Marinibactrum halimedae TaxID=1444977 RepID=A0AA37T9D0_9GAMM|nr:hypothetical protein [Marinibactrum halimedae]MCD9459196.1 hypothetical protein [Marinibactrum halimedae]GLS27268.1 hypothetical protein GCM10007877_29870 [Marinibactrum halimedae]